MYSPNHSSLLTPPCLGKCCAAKDVILQRLIILFGCTKVIPLHQLLLFTTRSNWWTAAHAVPCCASTRLSRAIFLILLTENCTASPSATPRSSTLHSSMLRRLSAAS